MERRDRCRRDEIAPPNERGRPAADIYRPHLVKREAGIIAAARIVKRIGGLEGSVCSGTAEGSAEREHALFIRGQQFPKSLAFAVEHAGELSSNFVVGPQQRVE